MPDREKVIKGLECCMKWTGEPNTATCHCSDCSYTNMDILGERCVIDLINDALFLLKEQEAKEGHWIVLEFCANAGIYCSECHMKIFDRITKPKNKLSQYCPHCGSRKDQFFRDGEVVFR